MNDRLFIYTDESGNTGKNFFDKNQPFFSTATIISPYDLENIDFKAFHNKLLSLGNNKDVEIHMNELNTKDKLILVKELVNFLLRNDIKLFFTEFDKLFMLTGIFINHIFDTLINKKMDSSLYNSLKSKKMLSFILHTFITEDNLKDYHKIFITNRELDKERYTTLFKNIQYMLYTSNYEYTPELFKVLLTKNEFNIFKINILNALEYAMDNQEILFENKPTLKFYNPDIQSKTTILNYINSFDENIMIEKIWFDELKAKGTKWMTDSAKSHHSRVEDDSLDIRKVDKELDFIRVDSKESFGIQIADVFAWLFSKYRQDLLSLEFKDLLSPLFSSMTLDEITHSVSHIKLGFELFISPQKG